MRRPTPLYPEDNSVAAGVRAAVLVIILGSFAAAVDHLGSRSNPTVLAAEASMPEVSTTVASDSFAVPASLRAHEGEIKPLVATF